VREKMEEISEYAVELKLDVSVTAEDEEGARISAEHSFGQKFDIDSISVKGKVKETSEYIVELKLNVSVKQRSKAQAEAFARSLFAPKFNVTSVSTKRS
jgi:hypothetical protein